MIKLINRLFDFLDRVHEQIKLAVKKKKVDEFKDAASKGDVKDLKDKFSGRDD